MSTGKKVLSIEHEHSLKPKKKKELLQSKKITASWFSKIPGNWGFFLHFTEKVYDA
jgi:hypothetical protein